MPVFPRWPWLALALLCPPALAQSPAPEQVLVTATRVPEDGFRLPLAWSSISAEDLALIGHTHINQAMQQVAGAWIARGNGQESLIALRSPVLTGAGSCGAFLIAGDGISLRAPGFCNVNQLFDANTEQAGLIEVIKGPATALYGSNAMHGLINVLSAAPSAALDANLAIEAGPYDYYRAKLRYGNTWGAHGLSVRINGTTDGGYLDDAGYDQQKATLRHDYDGELWRLSSVLDYANLNQETAGYIQGYKAYEDQSIRRSNPNPEAYRDASSLRFHTQASRLLNESNTLTITPYLRDNEMQFLQHFVPWQPVEENSQDSLGLRAALNTDLEDSSWANGLEAEYTDGRLKEYQQQDFSPNQPAGVHYDYQVGATVAAAFSQWRGNFQNWELSAGLRLEYTLYDYDNRTGDGSACAPTASACRFYRPADRDDDFTDWSANVGASYSLTPDTVSYLRLANGFRAPQTAELYRLQGGQEEADLDSEELDNVELGLRGSWRQQLEYDLSVYLMHKDNVIFQDSDRYNVSGAQTRHYGTELSLDYRFAEAWYFRFDGTWASHIYDSEINLLGSSDNLNGNTIEGAPETFGSARIGWNFPALEAHDGTLELEWVYLDSYYLDPENEHRYNGHSLFNLRLSGMVDPRWRGTLRITNLLDEDYAERADFGFGEYRYFVGEPRGAYLEISYQFGG
ncbi:MAG: TonB-dependent receptor [Halioglobus sp.]|nr:TonB-dependent receptor [Halioglobus sp.]